MRKVAEKQANRRKQAEKQERKQGEPRVIGEPKAMAKVGDMVGNVFGKGKRKGHAQLADDDPDERVPLMDSPSHTTTRTLATTPGRALPQAARPLGSTTSRASAAGVARHVQEALEGCGSLLLCLRM